MSIKPRTIVGSYLARRALPEGREALERALALLRAWPHDHASNRAILRRPTAHGSCARANRRNRVPAERWPEAPYANWLPDSYRDVPADALLAELRKLDEVAP